MLLAATPFHYQYVHIEPTEQIGLHEQDTWELSCILVGSGRRLIGNNTEEFSSGDLVLIPPHVPHCWYFDEQTTDYRGRIANITVYFQTAMLKGIARLFPAMEDVMECFLASPATHIYPPQLAKPIISLLKAMNTQTDAERAASVVLLLTMLAKDNEDQQRQTYVRQSAAEQRKQQIDIYLSCNLGRHISLESLAIHLGMNRSALCVFFRREFGITFSDYLNQRRIAEACRLLSTTSLPIQAVGYRVGYEHVPYFNRLFKATQGCTPKEYRQRSSAGRRA